MPSLPDILEAVGYLIIAAGVATLLVRIGGSFEE